MRIATILGTGVVLAGLAGCGNQDVILPGERLDIRDGMVSAPVAEVNQSLAVSLGTASVNADWTHRGGNATHSAAHLALSSAPQLAFAADIGAGNSRRQRISADPVVAGGVVYTMDAASVLVATGTNGARLWSVDLTPALEQDTLSGGAIAYGSGKVFATTAYGELVSIDAATGVPVWRQDLGASGGSAPTVSGDVVYVVGANNRGWAIDAASGRVRYTVDGAPSQTSFGAGPGVAVTSELAIFPFSTGQMVATFKNGGLNRWSSAVGGERNGMARAVLDGLTGGPVVVGDTVYAANSSGTTAAIALDTGDRIWTAHEGAVSTVWPAGNSIFLLNDRNELVRLDASSGDVVWRQPLADMIDRRIGKSRAAVAHYGPVVAGGLVWVASSDGQLAGFDPASGLMSSTAAIPSGAASAPVVAGQTLYVVSQNGQLLAFR